MPTTTRQTTAPDLSAQLAAAQRVVATFEAEFSGLDELAPGVGDAWNAAHDAVLAIETAQHQQVMDAMNARVDPNTLALVRENRD